MTIQDPKATMVKPAVSDSPDQSAPAAPVAREVALALQPRPASPQAAAAPLVEASPEPARLSPVARLEQRIIELRNQYSSLQTELTAALLDADYPTAKRLQAASAVLVNRLQREQVALQAATEKHDRRMDAELLIQLRKIMGSAARKAFVQYLTEKRYSDAAALLRHGVLAA